jgi:hypothetical protein
MSLHRGLIEVSEFQLELSAAKRRRLLRLAELSQLEEPSIRALWLRILAELQVVDARLDARYAEELAPLTPAQSHARLAMEWHQLLYTAWAMRRGS